MALRPAGDWPNSLVNWIYAPPLICSPSRSMMSAMQVMADVRWVSISSRRRFSSEFKANAPCSRTCLIVVAFVALLWRNCRQHAPLVARQQGSFVVPAHHNPKRPLRVPKVHTSTAIAGQIDSLKTAMRESQANSNILLEVAARRNGEVANTLQSRMMAALDEFKAALEHAVPESLMSAGAARSAVTVQQASSS
jgi:hypothetical protein